MTSPGMSPVLPARLADQLTDRLPDLLAPVLGSGLRVGRVEPLAGGASRQTWGVQVSGGDGRQHELVLRASDRSDLSAGSQHSAGMELEAASLRVAAAAGMPVPAVLCASDDAAALGYGYLISTRVAGETIPRRILRSAGREARETLLAQCAAALAALHAADPGSVPGLPADDPLILWRDWMDALGQPSAVFEIALRWLLQHRPAPGGTAVVHGDFRLGNLIVDESGLAAVLDWELVHRGDPLEDLGWFCAPCWRFARPDLEAGGLAGAGDFLDGYNAAAGTAHSPADLRFWQVLAQLRWSVIALQQALRFLRHGERSLELALTGRLLPALEWQTLQLTGDTLG